MALTSHRVDWARASDWLKVLYTASTDPIEINLFNQLTVPRSNWEASRLSDSQVEYAALDAMAGREIYLELRRRGRLPPDGLLEAMMNKWLLSGDEGDWRRARSLATERDSLRRLYQAGTGQSCFQRFPPS